MWFSAITRRVRKEVLVLCLLQEGKKEIEVLCLLQEGEKVLKVCYHHQEGDKSLWFSIAPGRVLGKLQLLHHGATSFWMPRHRKGYLGAPRTISILQADKAEPLHLFQQETTSSMELEAQRRRSSSASSSPEFEFWMVRNPSFPPQDLLTADELIVDGVLLPLHHLSIQRPHPADLPPPPPVYPHADPIPASIVLSSPTSSSSSRRWKDLFKVVREQKPEVNEKKKERRGSSNGSSELNINLNIWPFSRSRSAGNTAARPRSASRKISSAPCSRSNSRGESPGSRRLAASPSRSGVHLGRSSPVWQFRRTGMGPKDKGRKSGPATSTSAHPAADGGVRALNLNVNSCIGYRNQVSCRDEDSDGLTGAARTTEVNGGNGAVFSFRTLYKKVY
ncbi:hypothetical protein IEQ34_003205 [Dendrobium chrysotoxum]|uniref:Uncharacterized protein n=1 Tax=Dendrobium chrysotoxum TaxID=161865 RepID=A0AAV7HIK3_DENCH|nr:hypothetical protein IEQ34_003205 [Dendrobium chrysotoxum]